MKNIITSVAFLLLFMSSITAQTINWENLKKENKHMLNLNLGVEHGMIYGMGYGFRFITGPFPVVAGAEYSVPSGTQFLDDFKTKMGVQVKWIQFDQFQFSTRIQGVFRRYENDFARLLNFGSDMSGIFGYYRSKWFVAGEAGFDKAIVTHFKHSDKYKGQFAGVVDGWHEPAAGGNFYYGIQSGYSLGKNHISLKAGKILNQDFKTDPMIPVYAQLGYNIHF